MNHARSTDEKLVYMANQIVRNFAALSEEAAAVATYEHLHKFWDPRMKARITALAATPDHGLNAAALAAVAMLQTA